MSFIFSGSDGIYTGSGINVKPINNENGILVLKSVLKTAGWLIMGTSDGNSFFSTSSVFGVSASDNLTNALTGVTPGTAGIGSTANGRSWWVVQQTSSSGSFSFQNLGTAAGSGQLGTTSWRIKYSSKGFRMSSATTTATPQANLNVVSGVVDEIILIGGGTDASPSAGNFFAGNNATWFNVLADNAAPMGWVLANIISASSNARTVLLYDPMANTGSGEQDPYIIFANDNGGTDPWQRMMDNAGGTTSPRALMGPLTASQRTSSQVCAMRYSTTETNDTCTIPGGLGTNPFTGREDVFPIAWAVDGRASINNGAVLTGYKGIGTLCKWLANSKSYGDVIALTSSLSVVSTLAVMAGLNTATDRTTIVIPWTGSVVNV